MKLFIGLMSGTSMDGVDAALYDATSHTCLQGILHPYQAATKIALHQALNALQSLAFYSQLNSRLGDEFADAVLTLLKATPYSANDIVAIGSHGQTMCHDATAFIPYTVQLGCAHRIAEKTGISVVADFRTRDLVVGGQGAPFAPIYHHVICRQLDKPIAVINLGGIANISYLNETTISGYDIGPGNCLMDTWIDNHLGQAYDDQGNWALSGTIIPHLLAQFLTDSYFKRALPRSIGREYFSRLWLDNYHCFKYSPNDVQATLLELTAQTIANSVKALDPLPNNVFICGGGVHNQALFKRLSDILYPLCLHSTARIGIDPDFVEASMFAWLAEKTLTHQALDLQPITNARKPAILGAIYPAGIDKGN